MILVNPRMHQLNENEFLGRSVLYCGSARACVCSAGGGGGGGRGKGVGVWTRGGKIISEQGLFFSWSLFGNFFLLSQTFPYFPILIYIYPYFPILSNTFPYFPILSTFSLELFDLRRYFVFAKLERAFFYMLNSSLFV